MTPTIAWVDGAVELIDQTRLPDVEVVLRLTSTDGLVDAIGRLAVRGAPALGVAGAFGVALAVAEHGTAGPGLEAALGRLRDARPTAVNLARMVDRAASRLPDGLDAVLAEAALIRDEEVAASTAMGDRGADLVRDLATRGLPRTGAGDPGPALTVMTICNTGALASVERGTALAVVRSLHERGELAGVLALETRPLLQGSRLTAWELGGLRIPYRLLVDGAAASVLARGGADVVLTGADRVAANGDVANKVGTLSLALAAHHARVPFVVVAPESTVDPDTPSGAAMEIEERDEEEVLGVAGRRVAPAAARALNPAFDVTPANLVTAIVTDRRVIEPRPQPD